MWYRRLLTLTDRADPSHPSHASITQNPKNQQRETALMELSKKREVFPDLAPILWHTVGTMAALLQVRG